jgi:hypothetical protein
MLFLGEGEGGKVKYFTRRRRVSKRSRLEKKEEEGWGRESCICLLMLCTSRGGSADARRNHKEFEKQYSKKIVLILLQ